VLQKQTAKTSKTAKENDILDFVEILSQMAAPGMKTPVEIRENLCRSLAPMLPSSFEVFVVHAFLRLEPRFILTTPPYLLRMGRSFCEH
jgi:hypothetical protein